MCAATRGESAPAVQPGRRARNGGAQGTESLQQAARRHDQRQQGRPVSAWARCSRNSTRSPPRNCPRAPATDLDGESREFRETGIELYITFALALVFIYLVLAAQFESFVGPLVIMFTVPLAMTGALAGDVAQYQIRHWRHAQRVQPDRPGDAGRPDHQTRDSDRGIRQPVARQGNGENSRPSSKPRRCACGRF